MVAFDATLSPSIYLVVEASKVLQQVAVDGGTIENTLQALTKVRDVCIFNKEIIVIDPYVPTDVPAGGRLHRYMPDAMTEILPWVSIEGHLSACTSDGTNLYVSRYITPNPSEIVVLAAGSGGAPPAPTGTVIPMPPSVLANPTCCPLGTSCCDRLVDFAWSKHTGSFVGLFAPGGAGTLTDIAIDTQYLAEFSLNGTVKPWVNAGMLHGVGTFSP
jgi:hypothetical protein